jgi:hypothetical protein
MGLALASALVVLAMLVRGGGSEAGGRSKIVVTRAEVDRLREARRRETGPAVAPPSDHALVEALVDEEVLWREARARLGGDGDPVVRRRVETLRAALAAGTTGESDGHGAADPASGAFARADLVLRRYLVEATRLALANQAAGRPPSDDEIDAFAAGAPGRFALPARLRFEHVFLARDRRGDALERDAEALLASLSRAGMPGPHETSGARPASPADAAGRSASGERAPGDPFPSGPSFTGTPAAADRVFGAGFAGRVAALPRGSWAGPIASPFGLHLVRLVDASGPRPARPESIRSRAALAWRREEQARRLRDRLDALRARHEVRLETGGEGSPGGDGPPGGDAAAPSAGS